jgi:hypothetical protein
MFLRSPEAVPQPGEPTLPEADTLSSNLHALEVTPQQWFTTLVLLDDARKNASFSITGWSYLDTMPEQRKVIIDALEGVVGEKQNNMRLAIEILRGLSSEAAMKPGEVQQANAENGGIDLNATNMNMQIKRDGNGVPLPVAQQDLENINISGFVPEILSIQPMTSLPFLTE